jgi:hypothetical protein
MHEEGWRVSRPSRRMFHRRNTSWSRFLVSCSAGILICTSSLGVVGAAVSTATPSAAATAELDPTISCTSDPNLFNTG